MVLCSRFHSLPVQWCCASLVTSGLTSKFGGLDNMAKLRTCLIIWSVRFSRLFEKCRWCSVAIYQMCLRTVCDGYTDYLATILTTPEQIHMYCNILVNMKMTCIQSGGLCSSCKLSPVALLVCKNWESATNDVGCALHAFILAHTHLCLHTFLALKISSQILLSDCPLSWHLKMQEGQMP